MFRFFIFIMIISYGCKKPIQTNNVSTEQIEIIDILNSKQSYNYKHPQMFDLTSDLKEISGLSYSESALYTHNDEQGILFKLSTITGTVIAEYNFGKKGDYEGVEIIGKKAIIINSKGDLLFYNIKSQKKEIIKTDFALHNDVEGLGCNLQKTALLIACKGETLKGDAKNKEKAVYHFSLKKNKLTKKPFLKLKDKTIEKHLEKEFESYEISKKKKKQLKMRALNFSPSGIAVHPQTAEIYITSAKGNLVVIFDTDKKLKEIVFLNEKELPQPEGICFDDLANLYISTESDGSGGRIYKYLYN